MDKETQLLEAIEFIERLLVYAKAVKIFDFVKAFLSHSILKQDGVYYLHGSFKQGGTMCMTGDTQIFTKRGWKRLTAISIGEEVLTHTGAFKPVIDKFSVGEKPAYRVYSEQGREITVTGNHPFLINNSWVNADALKIGDTLTTWGTPFSAEIWKPITNWNTYEVSNLGRVRNKDTLRILANHVSGGNRNKYGHLKVTLQNVSGWDTSRLLGERKDFSIHKLVYETFNNYVIPEGVEIRHINGYAWDNRLENLTIGTSKENSQDSIEHGTASKQYDTVAKLDWEKVFFIRETSMTLNMSNQEVADLLSVSRELVRDVRSNKRWIIKSLGDVRFIDFQTEDKVKYIEKLGTPRIMYSLTVKDDESHITNGIVTHNSTRLSSSDPNLQNTPSSGKHGKAIKKCFSPPEGKIWLDADFAALTKCTYIHFITSYNS